MKPISNKSYQNGDTVTEDLVMANPAQRKLYSVNALDHVCP